MIRPTTCRDVCEHAREDLSGPEWEALRTHLERCPPCQEYLRQIDLTVEALRRLPGACGEQARAELLTRFEAWVRTR